MVAQAPRNAAPAIACVKRGTKSALQALYGVGQRFVVRVRARRGPEYPFRLLALTHCPEYFSKVRGNLRIGPAGKRTTQIPGGILELPHPEKDPSHAVDDERIVRGELQGLFDEFASLAQALIAVGKRIAECVVGVGVFRPDLDELAQRRLQHIDSLDFLSEHRIVVEQVRVVWKAVQRSSDQIECRLRLIRIAQNLRFRQNQLNTLLAVACGRFLQMRTGSIEVPLASEHLRVAYLRHYVLL